MHPHHLYLRRILPASSPEMPSTDVTASMTSCWRLSMSALVSTTYFVCRQDEGVVAVSMHDMPYSSRDVVGQTSPHLPLLRKRICCIVKVVFIIGIIHGLVLCLRVVIIIVTVCLHCCQPKPPDATTAIPEISVARPRPLNGSAERSESQVTISPKILSWTSNKPTPVYETQAQTSMKEQSSSYQAGPRPNKQGPETPQIVTCSTAAHPTPPIA